MNRRLAQLAVASANDGVVLADARAEDHPILYVNPAFERLTGYTAAEVRGRNCRFLQAEDRDQEGLAELREALREGRFCRVLLRNYRKDGTLFWNDLGISPVREETGRLTHFIGVQRDVTEARRREAALEQARNEARQFLDVAGVMLLALDRRGRITLLNRRGAELLRCTQEEALGLDWFSEFLPEPQREPVRTVFHQLMRGEVEPVEHYENPVLTRAGEERMIAWHNAALRDPRGRIAGILTSGEDVTERRRAEDAARERTRELSSVVEALPDLYFRIGADDRILSYRAPRDAELYRPPEDFLGRRIQDVLPTALGRQFEREAERARARQTTVTYEYTLRVPDGPTPFEARLAPLGSGGGLIALVRNISARKHAEASLRLAASVFSNTREGVMITDAQGRIVEVNKAFARLTGYAKDEVIGRNPNLLKSGQHPTQFYAAMWRDLREQGHWEGEITNRRADEQLLHERLAISEVRDEHGRLTHYVGVFADIGDIKAYQHQLAWQAQHDTLTGLPNRLSLVERLSASIDWAARQGSVVGVAYLDLDEFKPVNDTYGHAVGDQLLVEVARRLKDTVRTGDSVARLAGDEFVLVLTGCETVSEAETVLNRVLLRVATPAVIEGRRLKVSCSIGVAMYPTNGTDPDTLLRHADQAMYVAKQAGRDDYHFFDQAEERVAKGHRRLLNDFRAAIEHAQLRLYYQPKLSMPEGRVIGVEALVRWQHPQRGLLAPAQFLPEVENTGLALELDHWVIGEALRQMQAWADAGLELPVSVNIGARALMQPGLAEWLEQRLPDFARVRPEWLELEILETAAFADLQRVSDSIHACRRLGVGFALDDFGTGYSSLTYLKRLPAGTLKIDQTFVRDMLEDADDLAIVEGVIGLALAFDRTVVAEGVETAQHGRLLTLMGCDVLQGYGIARPMPAAEVPGWLGEFRLAPEWLARPDGPTGQDLPLASADTAHRQWVSQVLSRADGGLGPSDSLPLDERRCRFGQWYEGPARATWGELPELMAIGPIHGALHDAARELLELASGGDKTTLMEARERLVVLQQELVQALDRLREARP